MPRQEHSTAQNPGISVGNLDELLETHLSPERRARARKKADAILNRMSLDQLRKDRKITQRKLAEAMAVEQSEVSKIEKRNEVKLGTLRKYVGALGGHIEVRAVFPDKNVELSIASE